MYRIRSLKGRPLLIAPQLIREYARDRVDTLHMKNLLMLGEDRYLYSTLTHPKNDVGTKELSLYESMLQPTCSMSYCRSRSMVSPPLPTSSMDQFHRT
jgi:hypothetical protein